MVVKAFRDKLRAWERPLVLYEVIPAHASASREEVADSAAFIRTLLLDHSVDAINVPEVRNESRDSARKAGWMSKMDPRRYGMILRDAFGDDLQLVVNHPTVYEPADEQAEWFRQTVDTFEIANVVLVGGESSKETYPGPSPPEAARLAVKAAPGAPLCLGGIMIPTRHDEPERLVAKGRAGIEFFTSQVVFESHSTKALLKDYAAACTALGEPPRPIFLSFAPVTGRKDAEFLEWLGVQIPRATKEWMLATHGNALDRSTRVAEHVLWDVLDYCVRNDIHVPLGINVEHVMRYNFDASERLLDRLESLLEWKNLEGEFPA